MIPGVSLNFATAICAIKNDASKNGKIRKITELEVLSMLGSQASVPAGLGSIKSILRIIDQAVLMF